MLLAKIFFKFHALVQKCHFGEIEKLPGIETKNSNICVKQMFFTIFVKKSSFFGVKKKFDGNFFLEITKKKEKWIYQMKVGIKLGW